MTDPGRSSGKDSEQLLAEALRARAGGTPGLSRSGAEPVTARPVASRQPLTLAQLVLSAMIGGVVVGILIAVLTLI